MKHSCCSGSGELIHVGIKYYTNNKDASKSMRRQLATLATATALVLLFGQSEGKGKYGRRCECLHCIAYSVY